MAHTFLNTSFEAGSAALVIDDAVAPLHYREDIELTPAVGTLTDWNNQGALGGDVVPGGTPPTNGATGVVFTDTDLRMSADQIVSDVLSAAAWTIALVVNPVSHTSTEATAPTQPSFICDSDGFWGIHVKNGGGTDVTVSAFQWDGAEKTASISFEQDVRRVIVAWYDGTNINLEVDDIGAATPVAAGSISNVAGPFYFGNRLAGVVASTFENRIEEVVTWQTALGLGARTAVIRELNERHGLTSRPITRTGKEFVPGNWDLGTTGSKAISAAYGTGIMQDSAERFEFEWTGLPNIPGELGYTFLYDNPLVQLTEAGYTVGVGSEDFDSFETEWSNVGYFTALPATVAAAYDTTPENFENFEEEWSNDTYHLSVATLTLTAANFDSGSPEAVEDFEEEWVPGYAFDVTGITLTAALYRPAVPTAYENFEFITSAARAIEVTNAQAGDYLVIIDGLNFIYTATGGDTTNTIENALVILIAASSLAVTPTSPGPGIIDLRRDPLKVDSPDPLFTVTVTGPAPGDFEVKPISYYDSLWTQTGLLRTTP